MHLLIFSDAKITKNVGIGKPMPTFGVYSQSACAVGEFLTRFLLAYRI